MSVQIFMTIHPIVVEVWGCWTSQRTDQLCILCLIPKKQVHLAKSWIIHPNPTELKRLFFFNSRVWLELSGVLHAVSLCIRSSVNLELYSYENIHKVCRPQGLQRCSDRWGRQAQCPNSHPGFSIDLSHTSTHQLSYFTVQCYSSLSCFPAGI